MADAPERIVLVGFMGAGKTTVGALVARRLGWAFRDMDQWIEERTGLSVARLFEQRGEAAFRQEERQVAAQASRLERHVIAAGGGAFAQPETRALLQQGALTVWLRAELPTLLARIPKDGARPLAASRETISRLFAEREPSYRLADQEVDASPAAEEVARVIAEAALRRT